MFYVSLHGKTNSQKQSVLVLKLISIRIYAWRINQSATQKMSQTNQIHCLFISRM